MKIWHVGASSSYQTVDGLNYTVWSVAKAQASLGNQVSMLLESTPDSVTCSYAEKNRITLFTISANQWKYSEKRIIDALVKDKPDIVHMHNLFMPKQVGFAKKLLHYKVPYVITPHAMSPQLLQRGKWKKKLYGFLFEKPRFLGAAAITGVTPGEEKAIRSYVPNYRGILSCVPNPVNFEGCENLKWENDLSRKCLIYLGRFDILHKGIDILIEIARLLPSNIELHLYGKPDKKIKEWKDIQSNLPTNVYFHNPVFGIEKVKIMTEASMYIQTSRWEVFGISVAEAMHLGVPCAIAETMNLADVFRDHELGLILPSNVDESSRLIMKALESPSALNSWSEKSMLFSRENFNPKSVALQYLSIYEEVLDT